jgi:ACR3 family arsenite transporter
MTNAAFGSDAATISPIRGLSILDRFLAIWIVLAMALGIILGNFVPNTHTILETVQFVNVSVPIGIALPISQSLTYLSAIGLLVMMYPILCKVKYESIHHLFKLRALWTQILISFIINWIIAPLIMVSGLEKPWLRKSSWASLGHFYQTSQI